MHMSRGSGGGWGGLPAPICPHIHGAHSHPFPPRKTLAPHEPPPSLLSPTPPQLAQSLTTGDGDHYGGPPSSHRSSLLVDSGGGGGGGGDGGSAPSSGSAAALEGEESALSAEIARTIQAMTDLLDARMAPAAERTGRAQHSQLVRRYREILFDCTADFRKTGSAVARRREARELFRGAQGTGGSLEGGGGGGGGGRDEQMEHLLRERNAIGGAARGAEAVLGQASEVRAELRNQGGALRGIRGRALQVAGAVPGLNRLIDSIRRRRSRDDTILAGVIAACILFTLWYVLG